MNENVTLVLNEESLGQAGKLLTDSQHACAEVELASRQWNDWLKRADDTIPKLKEGMCLAMRLAEAQSEAIRILDQAHAQWKLLVEARRQRCLDNQNPELAAGLAEDLQTAESMLQNVQSVLVETDYNYEAVWEHMDRLDSLFADIYGLESTLCFMDVIPDVPEVDELDELDGDEEDDEDDGGDGDVLEPAELFTDDESDAEGELPDDDDETDH